MALMKRLGFYLLDPTFWKLSLTLPVGMCMWMGIFLENITIPCTLFVDYEMGPNEQRSLPT